LRLHGNNGYAGASHCYFVLALSALFYTHFLAIIGDLECSLFFPFTVGWVNECTAAVVM
jgi:hypothetical protein